MEAVPDEVQHDDEVQLEMFRGWPITKRTVSIGGGADLPHPHDLSKVERVRISFEADVVKDGAHRTKKTRQTTVYLDQDTLEVEPL